MTGSSPAQPRSRRSPAATGHRLLALAVLLVAVGVVAMHSLGAGHRVTAAAGSAPSDHAHQSGQAIATATLTTPTAGPTQGCADCGLVSGRDGAAGHGLMAACLAVLPVFLVLLRPRWRGWSARAGRLGSRPRQAGHTTSWSLADPDPRRPSLAELCVLRT